MKPYYEHGGATLFNGDVLQWCKEYEGEKFHAMLCDPPYELGFMGRDWDRTGIAFRPETWAALGEHLHPGAFCFAFASTRGVHRMACAIEDAGFILHPTIFLYAFGSGFPKATRIDTQIDRAAGAEREVAGRIKGMGKQNPEWNGTAQGRAKNSFEPEYDATEPATDLAKAWQGHRYGGQVLKPAVEPVICFQLPYAKGRKPVDCITETGAGALNIAEARLSSDGYTSGGQNRSVAFGMKSGLSEKQPRADGSNGRWPANFCVDEEAAKRLDLQSGNIKTNRIEKPCDAPVIRGHKWGTMQQERGARGYSDTGGASRFFFNTDWNYEIKERLAESEPVLYTSKASRRERNEGCEENANNHPTVKPQKLTTWLATLLLPPDIYAPRRVLVPFAGSGSEMLGCLHAGFEEVVGIEGEAEYCEINRARVAYGLGRIKSGQPATAQGQLFTAEPEPEPTPQPLTLFEVAA